MVKLLGPAALIGFLGGCSLLADDPAPLSGSWGNTSWEINATPSSLVLDQGCYRVTFPGPVVVTGADSFAVTGTVTASSWSGTIGQPWRMSGVVRGDTLAVNFTYLQLGTVDHWIGGSAITTLVAGQHADFSAITCVV